MKNLLFSVIYAIISFSLAAQTDIVPPVLDKPANAATNQVPDVQLDWFAVSGNGPVTYEVQIDTSDQFTNATSYTTSTSAQKAANLNFGDTYFWKVRATDNSGTSGWSDVRNFTVFEIVGLTAPENSTVMQMPDALLKWSNKKGSIFITGLTYYDLEVSLESGFINPVIVDSVAFGTFASNAATYEKRLSQLLFDTIYYWHIRARHEMDTSLWSETWSFRTLDGMDLSMPVEIEVVDGDNPFNSSAHCAKLIDNYQLTKSLDFINEDTVSIDFAMRADNKTVNSVHFKVTDADDNIFLILYFSATSYIETYNGTTLNQLMLYENGSTAAKWYSVKVVINDNSDNFDIYINNVLKANDFDFYGNPSGLPSEFIWYSFETEPNKSWIDEVNIYSSSESYFTDGFETGSLIKGNWFIEVPNPQNPDVELSWNPVTGINKYIFQISPNKLFTFPTMTSFSSEEEITVPSLEFGTEYFYRVKTYHEIDTSQWSEIGKINIINTVLLSSPANEATGQPSLPKLTWNEIVGADEYEVRWRSEDNTIMDTAFTPTPSFQMFKPLEMNVKYFWRVRAINNGDTTNWSNSWVFYTQQQGIASNILNENNIRLFPNPSNGEFLIELKCERNVKIQITIMDFVGKKVFEDTFICQQGSEAKQLNLSKLNSGLYFVRFKSGDSIYTEKLIIDK